MQKEKTIQYPSDWQPEKQHPNVELQTLCYSVDAATKVTACVQCGWLQRWGTGASFFCVPLANHSSTFISRYEQFLYPTLQTGSLHWKNYTSKKGKSYD